MAEPKTKQITATEIVIEYLKANGYDGLAGDDCGCEIFDLMPCDEFGGKCVPGHKMTKDNCKLKEKCEEGYCESNDFNGWCIIAGKRGE